MKLDVSIDVWCPSSGAHRCAPRCVLRALKRASASRKRQPKSLSGSHFGTQMVRIIDDFASYFTFRASEGKVCLRRLAKNNCLLHASGWLGNKLESDRLIRQH